MEYRIVKAQADDLGTVMAIIDSGREIMRSCGDDRQWPDGTPSEEKLRCDIEGGNSYLVVAGDVPVATFAFIPGPDPTYSVIEGGEWLSPSPYHVIHRLAKLSGYSGILPAVLEWCFSRTDNIRIDTHEDNAIMRHCLEKAGFACCGVIHLADGAPRLAFQKELSDT